MGIRAHRNRGFISGQKYVSTVSLLALAVAIIPVSAPSNAQQNVSAPTSQSTIAFNIPAQSLNSAILTYADKAGIQVFYDVKRVNGLRSASVRGSFTRQQALEKLLSGTGVTYKFSGNTVSLANTSSTAPAETVAPDGSVVLETITVQGANPNSTIGNLPEAYAGGQVAAGAQVGMLGNRSVMNTPFSQTTYTGKKIQDQQAETVTQVVSNDPSVVIMAENPGTVNDAVSIRGFSDPIGEAAGSLNGLGGMSPLYAADTDYIERVEVLRGPSALLNGLSGTGGGGVGGTVAMRTKQAEDEPITEITTRYASRSQLGTHVDIGRRFGAENQFGIRFNGAFRRGDGPVDPQDIKNGLAALNLDYRGERLRMSVDIVRQSYEASPYSMQRVYVSDLANGVPKAPDAGTSLYPDWTRSRNTTTMAMARGEFDITDKVTAYAAIGKQRSDLYDNYFTSIFSSSNGTFESSGSIYNRHNYFDVTSMQGGLRASVSTGPIDHALSFNAAESRFEQWNGEWSGSYSYSTNLYNPDWGAEPTLGAPPKAVKAYTYTMSGGAIADTMSILDESIQFTAGLRYQKVETAGFSTSTGERTDSYESSAWTPAFGIVVKPRENVSLYANYIQALQPGSVVGSYYANSGEVLPPYLSEQYEAGVKVDWGVVTTTLAVFQITQQNRLEAEDPAGGAPTLKINGQQRNRGIELNAFGELMPGVRLLGGVTLLDARLTSTASGAQDGYRAGAAPKFRAVLGAEWDAPFVEGLTLIGRISYTGDQVANSSYQDSKLPSYTLLDLGARYSFNSPWNAKPITIRFNVDNVFDKDYWTKSSGGGYLYLGAPRTFRLSTSFKF